MRYELTDHEWAAIKPMPPNKPRGVARVNDRRVLNGIFWVLRSGAFSLHLYRARNLVERFFNKIKQCRRVATRYDKLTANDLAFVQLASIRLWVRANESTPQALPGATVRRRLLGAGRSLPIAAVNFSRP
jgi:transposase